MKEPWEQEMEDFVNGMSDEEFEQFKKDTGYERYTSESFKKISHWYPNWLQKLCEKHGT